MASLAPVLDPPDLELLDDEFLRDVMDVSDEQLESIVLSDNFREFAEAAWPVIEPGTEFVGGPHIDAICMHLQAVTETHERLKRMSAAQMATYRERPEDVRRLLITMPPRMGKSNFVSILWPAWEWTRNPSLRYLTTSYDADLAMDFAVRTRSLIQSEWYQARWGHLFSMSADQNMKSRYDNNLGGRRTARGTRGGSTGAGGERVVVDDPHNANDAHNAGVIAETVAWWGRVMSSRVNDRKRDCFVVIQQRVADGDLAGHLIESGGWCHLNLPMEYEGEPNCTQLGWCDWRTQEGEFLSPERYGPEEKEKQLKDMGEIDYAGQYQQRPVPVAGAILKKDNWARYTRAELPERFQRVAAFADTAHKKETRNDFTAIALWGEGHDGWYLLDLVHQKFEFPALQRNMEEAWEKWSKLQRGYRPRKLVIEPKASGLPLIQTLQHDTRIPIESYMPSGDKIQRVYAISGYHESKRLHLPLSDTDGLGEIDVEGFISEHTMFPNGRHDDRVDTTTMMMMYFEIEPPEEEVQGTPAMGVVVKGKW